MSGLERVKQLRAEAKAAVLRFNAGAAGRAIRISHGEGPVYHGATFLYVRGYDGDHGQRPIPPGQVFWDSPDIELFDSTGVRIANNQLAAGSNYTAEVVITNDGDLDCNTCVVELFLDNPSIGFDIAAATSLGTQIAAVGKQAKAAVRFPFTATAAMTGHRCMFARVSSIVTNDVPSDWIHFAAMQDRHLGQQNLNIVKQGTALDFNVHLLPALRGRALVLDLVPEPAAFTAAPPPIVGRYRMVPERATALRGAAIARRDVEVIAGQPARRELAPAHPLIRMRDKNRWTFQSSLARDTLRFEVPDLGLRANEALPLELKLTDPATGEVVGGLTLLVVA